MTLSREQIAGLRSLLAKATPKWDAPGAARHGCDFWRIGDDAPYTAITKTEADARLIHAAVNALPALLDIAEAVMALRDQLRIDHDSFNRWGLHGHTAVDDDYFTALEYVLKKLDAIVLPLAGENVSVNQLKEIADRFTAMAPGRDGWFTASITYQVEAGAVTKIDDARVTSCQGRQPLAG